MWIVPPGLKTYISIVPTTQTEYQFAGPNGVRRMLDGPQGMGQIKGTNVYETPVFDLLDRNDHVALQDRRVTTGEFMTMTDTLADMRQQKRDSGDRSIIVFDEDQVRFSPFYLTHFVRRTSTRRLR